MIHDLYICSRPSRDKFDEKDAERESVLGRSEISKQVASDYAIYEKYRNGASCQNAIKIAATSMGSSLS